MNLNKFFRKLPEAVVVVAPDFTILDANDTYLRVLMRERDEIVGKHFLLEAFPDPSIPFEENPVKLSIERAIQTKEVDYFPPGRYDIRRPDGSYDSRYWEATHTPVLDDEGQVEFVIQITTDVTEREKAKQALQESENRFRFMAEAMPQLIFTTDTNGQMTYINKRWSDYTGRQMEGLEQEEWSEVIHPDDFGKLMADWNKAIATGEDLQAEIRIKDRNGKYRWFLNRSLPMRDEQGQVRMWVSSSTDIHDTRQMVQELLETNEQMAALSDQVQHAYQRAEAERRILERLIMKAPAFFCILRGPEHRYELVNENYQKLFPAKQLLNRTVKEALPEVVEQGFISILDKVYTSGEDFVAENVRVQLDRFCNGELEDVFVSFIYQPIYDEANKISGILVFGYEVTEAVKIKQKLQELGLPLE